MSLRELVELPVGEIPSFMTDLDASIRIVDDGDAFAGEPLVLVTGIHKVQHVVVLQCL